MADRADIIAGLRKVQGHLSLMLSRLETGEYVKNKDKLVEDIDVYEDVEIDFSGDLHDYAEDLHEDA